MKNMLKLNIIPTKSKESLNNRDIFFILSLRSIFPSPKIKKSEAELFLTSNITSKEHDLLYRWNNTHISLSNTLYSEYTPSDLKQLLELKTHHTFPIPLELLGKKSKELLLSYYFIKGYQIEYKPPIFTNEQLQVINHIESQIPYMIVTNSGPGTGKTSCANERAYRLRHEKVLLISYTNEAINENYIRFKEYPKLKGIIGKKKYNRQINIATTDSLAGFLTYTGENTNINYDTQIRKAITLLQNSKPRIHYDHIIVDESQDIDNLRAELILTYFHKTNAKSICIFGDPRQQIKSNSGQWYIDLWTNKASFINITRIGLSQTHRFKNKRILDLTNDLSRRRTNIHHELSCETLTESQTPIQILSMENSRDDYQLKIIATYIKNLHDNDNVPYSEIAVVGPSLVKDNKTSGMAKRICSVFRDSELPCYTKSEGSYLPDAILFSTIHSIKGKEFDYLFIYGMSNFTDVYHMIPYSEAESLIYVLHSRARKQMYYFCPINNFQLPRGVLPSYTNIHEFKIPEIVYQEPENIYKDKYSSVTDLVSDFNITKFLMTNQFYLYEEEIFHITHLSQRPKDIDPRFWGVICGMIIEMILNDKYPSICRDFASRNYEVVSGKEYSKLLSQGQIIAGKNPDTGRTVISNDGVNILHVEEVLRLRSLILKNISDLTGSDIIFLARIYDFIISGTMMDRTEINIQEDFLKVAKSIEEKFGPSIDTEVQVSGFEICGAIDSIHEKYIIEFKTKIGSFTNEDKLQVWLYHIMYKNMEKIPILVNLQNGTCSVVKSNRTMSEWKYMLNSYVQLKTHCDLVTKRSNKIKSLNPNYIKPQYPINTFVIDTEFTGDQSHIFDIAIVNINDPYRSILQTVKIPDMYIPNAIAWSPMISRSLLENSYSINEIKRMLLKITELNPKSQLILCYYICNVDCSWCPEAKAIDLGANAKKYGKKNGIFLSGSQPPKLTDLYGSVAMPLDFQSHLKPHTALSDTLILYELLSLGIL